MLLHDVTCLLVLTNVDENAEYNCCHMLGENFEAFVGLSIQREPEIEQTLQFCDGYLI